MRNLVIFTLTVALLAGCQAVVSPTKENVAQATLDLTKPGAVIKNLVIGKVNLPKSLQDGSTNPAAQSAKSLSRALGDVTPLTSLNTPSLKASGYQDFRQTVDRGSTVKMFLEALKTVPSVADGTLPVNATIDTGTILLDMGNGMTVSLANSGKLSTSLSGDGQTLSIYWNLLFPDQSQASGSYATPQQMFDALPRTVLSMYFEVTKGGAVELFVYRPDDGKGHYMNYWNKFDPATGENLEAQDSNWTTSVSTSVSMVKPQAGGGFLIYRNYTGSYNHETLGYADDQFGGIVNSGVDRYDDGSGTPTDHSYLNVEFYDGTGDLIYQGYGQSAKNASNWNWRFNQGSSTNLHDLTAAKPATFSTRQTWKAGVTSDEISFDGGATWAPYTRNGWDLVYHDPVNDQGGTWTIQAGDAIYWSDSYQSSFDTETNAWTWTVRYFKGYEVPQGETYFGQTYFVNKTYPLKNLLPLKAQYATGFEVTQKEQETWYNWRKVDGSWGYGNTEPAVGDYQPGSLYHYTNYDYWLENKAYKDTDGNNTNDPKVLDRDKGDVWLQLQNFTVYSWNSALGQSVKSEAPAFSTYQEDLPPYFSLDQAKIDAVAATKAKLEAFYATKGSQTAAALLTGFSAKMAPVLPLFPDMTGYPGLPAPVPAAD